ncbi:MAG: hypothetical protein PUB39_07490 [Eubacteriales bacterium]|nr:hypothetical protein [Eubacteriales bacterium]
MPRLDNNNENIVKRNMKTLRILTIMDTIIGTIFMIMGFLEISVKSYGYTALYLALAAAFLGLAGMYWYRYRKLARRNM